MFIVEYFGNFLCTIKIYGRYLQVKIIVLYYSQLIIFLTLNSEQSDKNPPNDNGLTPFHLSCAYGHIKIVEIFVKNSVILNIDLNSVTYTCGWTGFHCACQNGQLEIAEFLMENSDIFDIDVTGFILLETSVIAKNSTYVAISVAESADLRL